MKVTAVKLSASEEEMRLADNAYIGLLQISFKKRMEARSDQREEAFLTIVTFSNP